MISIASLWLPIVLSAVIVFIASAAVWMLLPHHKGEWKGLPDEEAARAAALPRRWPEVPPGAEAGRGAGRGDWRAVGQNALARCWQPLYHASGPNPRKGARQCAGWCISTDPVSGRKS